MENKDLDKDYREVKKFFEDRPLKECDEIRIEIEREMERALLREGLSLEVKVKPNDPRPKYLKKLERKKKKSFLRRLFHI